jgi:hypothetical protein
VSVSEAKSSDPRKSPTYPQRVHIRERAQWQAVLSQWSARIATARSELGTRPTGPKRGSLDLLYAQMLGARDQIDDAVRRLPMEVGDMYEEDRHRLEEAVAALERLFTRWEAAKKS